jgi:hypothetical protein
MVVTMKQKFLLLSLIFLIQTSNSFFFVDGTPSQSDEFESTLQTNPMPVAQACNALVKFSQAETPHGELWSMVEATAGCYRKKHDYDFLQEMTLRIAHQKSLSDVKYKTLRSIFKRQKAAKIARDERDAQPAWDPFTALWAWLNS